MIIIYKVKIKKVTKLINNQISKNGLMGNRLKIKQ
jgi:hypothetical protein